MKLEFVNKQSFVYAVLRKEFHSCKFSTTPQVANKLKVGDDEFVSKLLDRRWALVSPDTKIHQIKVSKHLKREQAGYFGNILFRNNPTPLLGDGMLENSNDHASFYVVRDDLLHPLVNGNKIRKLDGLLPLLEDNFVTDVLFHAQRED